MSQSVTASLVIPERVVCRGRAWGTSPVGFVLTNYSGTGPSPFMYNLESIKEGLGNPRLIFQEINRLYYRRMRTWSYNRDGINFLDQDWDQLCILDACPHDLFERVATLPGELDSVISRGSATEEFIRGNFKDREFLDTVYVTASPMLHRHRDKHDPTFHNVINVWKEDGWDDEYRTVLPETVNQAAFDARERYPNKRLLIHYLQPHYPFIGPTGQKHFDLDRLDFEWDAFLRGDLDVSDEIIWEAFEENLEIVLPYIETLLDQLQGKTVVTADHGQMVGSRSFPVPIREYGHPKGIYTDQLVKVPWLTHQHGTRPTIKADRPRAGDSEHQTSDVAQKRLQELGYVE